MAVFDILPQTNLSGNDIRDTLASGGGNVGNSASSWFKPEAKINMWSKYKPVDFSQENTSAFPEWWRGNNGTCSIDVPTSDGDPALLKGLLTYILPQNGSPKRMGDFRGYLKGAQIPFQISFPKSITIGGGESVQLRTSASSGGTVGFEDIYPGTVYFGLCVKVDAAYLFKTADISGGGARISIQDCPLIAYPKTVELYAFITKTRISNWTASVSQAMYSLNAIDNYAFAEVVTKVPAVDTYYISPSIPNPMDRRKITTVGSPSLSGGIISINGRVDEYLTYNYTLKDILVRAVDKDTYQEITRVIRPIDGNSSPKYLDKNELIPPFNLIFAATFNDPDVPRDAGQVYDFYYSLTYEQE